MAQWFFALSLFVFSMLSAMPCAAQNVALGKPVTPSGAVHPGLFASSLTDGLRSGSGTIAHPAAGATLGYYFQTDLGAEYPLNRIVIFNRDNCCPERLTNYRVTVYANNAGTPGAVRWQANIRTDGTNSGLGGADTITAGASTNGAHLFNGRFVRVENLSGAAYNPQIAEIEVYPEAVPVIRYFLTDAGNIGGAGLPSSANLSWQVDSADSVVISGIGAVGTSGTTTVTPTVQTTYTITASRASGATSTASVNIAVNAPVLAPVITELQAADGSLEDEDGERPDWIELRNPNTFTLNLAGYALTDTAAAGDDWTFPLSNIAPGGYLVVFASQKNRTALGANLHTNFSLNASGEYLALLSPGGATLQQFPADYPATLKFPKQYDRVSYGTDGSGNLKYLHPATPGAVNGAGFDGVVADTVFSVKRGIFTSAQTVALSTATSDATIRYTTNSTAPTATTGTVYTGPITVSTTTTLRAAAFKTGFVPTNVDTNTYIFPADVVSQPTMSTVITGNPAYGPQMVAALTDIPSVSLVTPNGIVNGSETGCSIEYIPVSGVGVHENAGVELFGGAFTNFEKKSFRVKFSSDYGATKIEIPGVFSNHARGWKPVEKFNELELRSGSHDMKLRGFSMANPFTDAVLFENGDFSTHGRFVHLYYNGTYWGMYHLRERWDAAHHSAYFGGPKSAHESINGNYNVGGWAEPGDAYDGTGATWTYLKANRANVALVSPLVNLTNYVDFMVMWMFGNSENEWRHTGPATAGSGAKFWLNDADGYLAVNAWDGNSDNTTRSPSTSIGRLNGDGPGGLLSALHYSGNADFRTLVADRIHRLLFGNGALTPAANTTRLNALCTEIQRAFYADAARWSQVNTAYYRTPSEWLSYRDDILNNWFPTRTNTVISQLQSAGYYPTQVAPTFTGGTVASGTTVSFPVSGATVYFTTDGSDPRLPGGNVNPAATTASTATLTKNTWLRARSRTGTTWSALNEAFYTVTTPLAPGDVVFSEIHFNPLGDDDAEFIELWNPTDHAVNLRGAKFSAGISWDFAATRDIPLAPGGRLLLVANLYAFQARYGTGIPVEAVYFDRLGNDGDTLTLATAAGTPVVSVNYDDTAPWPDSADGGGHSLVLANPTAPGTAASWRTSTASGGNPGASDSAATFTGSALADADTDGVPALIEHFLNTSDAVPAPPALVPGIAADGRSTITFTRRLAADDLTYIVETSPNLAQWNSAATRISHLNNGNGTATEVWAASAPTAPQFLRLRITKP